MSIPAQLVKELREKTGVGMMECKKALEENTGDMEKAILWLRERGMSRAAKKADRVAAEGMIQVQVSADKKSGVLVELNCETDFVSKNEDFSGFVQEVANIALTKKMSNTEELLTAKMKNGNDVKGNLTELIAKIGENMNLRRVQVLSTSNGVVSGYTHMGGKIGTLVVLEGATGTDVEDLGKDLAMHVAAAAPRFMVEADVNAAELEQERELARKKLAEEGKPAEMIEKILVGQMKKFFKEVCFIEQAFIKDPGVTVLKHVENTKKGLKVASFARFHLGEGIEKKKENFADEVAAQLKK
jgi:elongation factor Ts